MPAPRRGRGCFKLLEPYLGDGLGGCGLLAGDAAADRAVGHGAEAQDHAAAGLNVKGIAGGHVVA